MQPIWKDTIIILGTADSYEFRILRVDNSEVLYQGKAFRRPGETNCTVRINDICEGIFTDELPSLTNQFTSAGTVVSVKVQILVSGVWTDKETVEFTYDWSYKGTPASGVVAAPINGIMTEGMPLFVSAKKVTSVSFVIHYTDGTTSTTTVAFGATPTSGTARYNIAANSDIDHIVVGTLTYKIAAGPEYALYYRNSLGGWDAFVIEGNVLESDEATRHTMEVRYDNGSESARGRRNYVNEVAKTYTMHTGWLDDAQSERMSHLMQSTDVYLYDIAAGTMRPVIVETNNLEHKTFKNNGRQLISYTIEASLAQNRIRK